MPRQLITIALTALTSLPPIAAAQTPAPATPPCQSALARQFDFWIGTWDLTGRTRAQPGSDQWTATRSTNTIRAALDGCAIVESFVNVEPSPWSGMSLSSWDARSGKWRQTWVDTQGGYIPLSGEFQGGRMTLITPTRSLPGGGTATTRMVFHDITADAFGWDWELSGDDGQTWETQWSITYRRHR